MAHSDVISGTDIRKVAVYFLRYQFQFTREIRNKFLVDKQNLSFSALFLESFNPNTKPHFWSPCGRSINFAFVSVI